MRLAAVLTALLLTAACAPDAGPSAEPDADTLLIAATPWPLAWLAAQIAPQADVQGLGQAGQDPHELDLRPGERQLLDRADAIFHIGPVGFQPQVEEAAAARPEASVAVVDAAGDLVRAPGEERADGHDDELAGDHDDAHGDGHGGVDPHLWFDPRTLAAAAPALAERLAEADPDGADGYRERAEAVAQSLTGLNDDLDGILSGCAQDSVVVGHEAFAYLLASRGLEQIGVSGVGGHGEASPGHMAELAGLIRDRGITAVLTEPVEGREAAEALAREAGVALVEVQTLESPEEAERASGYPDLMREQARVFAGALECGA